MSTTELTKDARSTLIRAIQQSIERSDASTSASDTATGIITSEELLWIDHHLETLIDIARRTTAHRIEPYLCQMIDHICSKCGAQAVDASCTLRTANACPLFRHARAIFAAITAHLLRVRDERYLLTHPEATTLYDDLLFKEPFMFKKILIAVGEAEHAEPVVRLGGLLAIATGAQTLLLHVLHPSFEVRSAESNAQFSRSANMLLSDLRKLIPSGVEVTTRLSAGLPADKIVEAAREMNADVIVVGDHRPHTLSTFLLGSTADAVVRRAPCSVLVARETTWAARNEHAH